MESIHLSDDKSVSIKLEGEDEIAYKSPKALFLGGIDSELKMREDREELKRKCPGLDAPLIFGGHKLIYTDFSNPESAAILKKDLEVAYVATWSSIHESRLDGFAGIERSKNNENFILRDEIFQGVPDRVSSDILRMANSNEVIRIGKLEQEQLDYFAKIKKENPELMSKSLDFFIRTSLSSSHDWSFAIFQLLKNQPDTFEGLDKIHKEYSLPYLIERDYYSRWRDAKSPEEKIKLKSQIREVFEILGIDHQKIQQTLKDLGSDREYCPGFFTEK